MIRKVPKVQSSQKPYFPHILHRFSLVFKLGKIFPPFPRRRRCGFSASLEARGETHLICVVGKSPQLFNLGEGLGAGGERTAEMGFLALRVMDVVYEV